MYISLYPIPKSKSETTNTNVRAPIPFPINTIVHPIDEPLIHCTRKAQYYTSLSPRCCNIYGQQYPIQLFPQRHCVYITLKARPIIQPGILTKPVAKIKPSSPHACFIHAEFLHLMVNSHYIHLVKRLGATWAFPHAIANAIVHALITEEVAACLQHGILKVIATHAA